MDIIYHGSDPPQWIAITQSNTTARGNLTGYPLWIFGGKNWTRIATYTWTPIQFLNGPTELLGQYVAFETGDFNNWPNDNFSFYFAVGVSKLTLGNQPLNSSTTSVVFYIGDTYTALARYYGVTKTVTVRNFDTTINGIPSYGQVFRWDLSDSASSTVAGLSHIKILREFYGPIIIAFGAFTGFKIFGIASLESDGLKKRLKDRQRLSWFARRCGNLKASILATLEVTILVFIPIYQFTFQQYVPPWVTYFDSMTSTLFYWFILLLLFGLVLTLFDEKVKDEGT